MRRSSAALLAASLVLLAAAGCTKSDPQIQSGASTTAAAAPGTSDPGIGAAVGEEAQKESERLKEAASKTGGITSGRVSLVVSVTDNPTLGTGENTVVDLSGSYADGGTESEMTVDFTGLAQAGGFATADLGGNDPAELFREPLEIISADGAVYYRSPSLLQALGVSTEWMKVDAGSDSFGSLLAAFTPANVSAFVAALGSVGEVKQVGKETIDGVRTTHDRVTVELATIEADARAAITKVFGDLGSAGSAQFDIWIDPDGGIRRLRVTSDAAAIGKALDATLEGASATATIEFTDIGKPVTVTVPSGADVTDRATGKTTTTRRSTTSTTENPYRR